MLPLVVVVAGGFRRRLYDVGTHTDKLELIFGFRVFFFFVWEYNFQLKKSPFSNIIKTKMEGALSKDSDKKEEEEDEEEEIRVAIEILFRSSRS